VAAAAVAVRLPEVGGLDGLFSAEAVAEKLRFVPALSDADLLVSVFVVPLAVQWWSVWYPGSEPGGGGYLVQRMLAAKDETNAVLATFLFNAAHYALRPWPWIIVALCSVVVFPDLESLRSAFPSVDPAIVRHDMAYPAMLTRLPHGLLGLVAASLIAAYMSTISTHLNWGCSYIVNDVYRRFINPAAGERRAVLVGRVSTVLLMVAACLLARCLENAKRAFDLILQIGAGTGLLFILRWFWWRINAFSEITAMAVSFLAACYFELVHPHTGLAVPAAWQKLVAGVSITTAAWVAATFLAPPADERTLRGFYRLARPGGPGWRRVLDRAAAEGQVLEPAGARWPLPAGVLCMFLGTAAVYGALFATGCWIYGRTLPAAVLTAAAAVSAVLLLAARRRV
jgi:Na+/proline symporter